MKRITNAFLRRELYTMNENHNYSDLLNFNTSQITNLKKIFLYDFDFNHLEFIKDWNVENCIDCFGMFEKCINLKELDPLSNWNVENVMDFSKMFAFTKICDVSPLENWNVNQNANFSGMFHNTFIKDFTPLQKWFPNKEISDIESILRGP